MTHIAAVSIIRDGNGWRSTVTGRRGPARVKVSDYDRDKSVVLNCAAKRVMSFRLGPVEIQEVVA